MNLPPHFYRILSSSPIFKNEINRTLMQASIFRIHESTKLIKSTFGSDV